MSDDLCRKCGHPSGPHVLASTVMCTLPIGTEVPAGGHMFCPVPGCECHSTWSIPDATAGFDVCAKIAELGTMTAEKIKRVRGH